MTQLSTLPDATIQRPDLRPALIVGASGKTGRRIADRLDARGVPVRRAGRSTEPRFDWTDRTTWASALEDVGLVYISYQPDLIADGAVADIAEFVRLADKAGAARLVLLAGRGEPEAEHAGRVVHAAQADSTVLSCAWFDQNFSEGGFAPEIDAGSLTLPVGEIGEPFIDADDIADVAVAALLDTTSDGENPHAGKTYDLTGPRLLTFAEVATELGGATGAAIAFHRVTHDEYRAILASAGLDAPTIELMSTLLTNLFDGRNSSVTTDVADVLGRPARDFTYFAAAFAERHR
uniref:NmrA family transcriptional regulator n=1 Tax=Gordonia sp. B7-2 TaxID=3420932 RepID=UPI003D8BE1E5